MSVETIRTNETLFAPPDLLIVLGKNIGVGSTQMDIQKDRFHLSRESRFSSLAAGMLWQPGMDVLFSTGKTAGPEVPSEASAMKSYLKVHFPDIPDENILMEETSIDTAGNAEEVSHYPNIRSYDHIGLLSVGYHVANAATLFERYGVNIEQKFASEDILRQRSDRHNHLVDHWKSSDRIKKEETKEAIRRALLFVDRKGRFLRKITNHSRA
jgi:uncharacterized SAM-binding protein YcdF (DUF218 family)